MRLSELDLNLFVAFDAIYAEGNLTRAAQKLRLTQPALSHALARLRELFHDPLFVRTGHTMVPTPFARNLVGHVQKALSALEQGVFSNRPFDPKEARRSFQLGMPGELEGRWLPGLMTALDPTAGGVDITSVRVPRSEIEVELAAGTLDLALDVAMPVSEDIRQVALHEDRLMVLARRDHPALTQQLTLDAYLSQGHVLVSSRRKGPAIEDLALNQIGQRRRVMLRCQNHFAACMVVRDTDLLLTMSEQHARITNAEAGNRMWSLPFEVPRLAVHLYWHGSAENDPANRFLRELLVQFGKSAVPPPRRARVRRAREPGTD